MDTLDNDDFEVLIVEAGGRPLMLCSGTSGTSVRFWTVPPPIHSNFCCTVYLPKPPTPPNYVFVDVPRLYLQAQRFG